MDTWPPTPSCVVCEAYHLLPFHLETLSERLLPWQFFFRLPGPLLELLNSARRACGAVLGPLPISLRSHPFDCLLNTVTVAAALALSGPYVHCPFSIVHHLDSGRFVDFNALSEASRSMHNALNYSSDRFRHNKSLAHTRRFSV